jgi:hypothetical protein
MMKRVFIIFRFSATKFPIYSLRRDKVLGDFSLAKLINHLANVWKNNINNVISRFDKFLFLRCIDDGKNNSFSVPPDGATARSEFQSDQLMMERFFVSRNYHQLNDFVFLRNQLLIEICLLLLFF